ncbi:hypothetical protein CANINC_003622 [Pichia inconspicua]|uniref:Activator of C kinase protein 1 n=1 Tax=Pichia inconspicua TaxID=52247 RepID=A0A4T0WY92_9ASCO|nr:hypothetical protein CANINC_003622 [[Candida] inconspicua]
MTHPYRQQLSNSLGEDINVVNQNDYKILPHQILADQSQRKNPHPFLRNLPADVSKSLESLHLSSAPTTPINKSFDNESTVSKDTSISPDSLNVTNNTNTNNTNITNGIRKMLTDTHDSPIQDYFEKAVHRSMASETENARPRKRSNSVANLIHPVLHSNPDPESNPSQEPNPVNHLPIEDSIEMYRQNAKKTKDPQTLLIFAQILIKTALMKNDNKLTQRERDKYIDEAHSALKKAAKAGLTEAQYYLGDAFSVGLFNKGKPDLSKSLMHFESAGKSRHAESAYRTAICYKKGWGCTRDARKVVKYLEIAAMNNHPVAMMEYGIYAFHGLMSFPDDVNTKKQGISWLRRATESATELSCGAPYELALIYMNGFKDIVIPDTKYAIKLLFKAANLGHAKSASMLGKFYEIGDIVEQNADLSIHFYNMGATLGDVDGMMGLCSWYFVGSSNLQQDYNEAFAWALRAADLKHVKAMLLLEKFYTMGLGCEKNIKLANYWAELAKSQNKK